MHYNIYFEICSLSYLIIITIYFFLKRKYLNRQGKVYAFYILFVFLDIITNMISIFTIENAASIPLIINILVNSLYTLCQFTMPSILYLYVISSSQTYNKSYFPYIFIPLGLGILSVLLNPITHQLFYFDQNLSYTLGPGQWQLYINGAFYILATLIYVSKHHKKLGKNFYYTVIAIVAILIFGLFLQYFNPDLLITGTGAVTTLFMLYFVVENPDNYIDNVTSCLNRSALISKLDELYFKKTYQDITLVSLTDFKTINDVYGLKIGDMLLKEVGLFFQSIVNNNSVFRINGDIFIIITPLGDNLSNIIEQRFKDNFKIGQFSIHILINIAILSLQHYQNYHEVIQMLEYSIQEIKTDHDKTTHIIDTNTKKALIRKNSIIYETKNTIKTKEIEVFYQPLYDTNNKIKALEALIRFKSLHYGYIPADEFITICEQNGTIIEIGKLVIEKVCQFLNDYQTIITKDRQVAINLSVVQLIQPSFFDDIIKIFNTYHIESSLIIFEITESSTLYSHAILMKNVKNIASYGFSLSMDDYGTGYASINNMITLPISTVKIDKTVVWAAMNDAKARIILVNTIKMLLALDFKIVCEGIETIEQVNEMRLLGVHYLQGFYFSKPVNQDKIIEILKKATQ